MRGDPTGDEMGPYDRLVVPVDGSDAANQAAVQGMWLAGLTGAELHAVHVVDDGRPGTLLGGTEREEILQEHGRKLLGDVERLAEGANVAATTALLSGTPYREILAYAGEHYCDLVVMGRRGHTTVGQQLIGGVTDKVLRAGDLPVLSVTGDGPSDPAEQSYERILVPTDGSECAEVAADHGAALAELTGASVHVVSVADVRAAGGLFDAGGVSEEFVRAVEARHEEAVERMASTVGEVVDRPVETAVVDGTPSEALRTYVAEHDVDAVVVGAHGRSGVRRWLIGSVTERLLRTVDVPLLVVPCVE